MSVPTFYFSRETRQLSDDFISDLDLVYDCVLVLLGLFDEHVALLGATTTLDLERAILVSQADRGGQGAAGVVGAQVADV